jgi:signal transduction histidine kinase
MSAPGSLAAALGFVPNWWQETSDPSGFDALLVGWAKACGWKSAGFVWPAEGPHAVVKTAHPAGVVDTPTVPAEAAEAVRHARTGEATYLAPTAGTGGRVFAAVRPAGRPMGLLWADRPAGQPWSEADRACLALTAKVMDKAPVVAAATGPVIDPDRLLQRLSDAAVIAGRMAHDFDNILTGIIGFADLSVPMIPAGSQAAGFVAEISKVGQRGIQFTQQLHQLSRSGQTKPSPGAVGSAVTKEEARLRPTMPAGLRVDKEIPGTLPPVAVEATPLQTVLGHLLANAAEASAPGGLVTVSARPVELTEADARGYLGKVGVGAHLEIAVTDFGSGIKPEVRRRLFAEPFFTTKVRHRGLGLAISYRLLCAHRGGIALDPVPPPAAGTRARIVLPLAARPAPAFTGNTVAVTTVGG